MCISSSPEDTRQRFYRRFCWSARALYTGRWPTHDERGRCIKTAFPGTRAARMAGKPLAGEEGSFHFFVLWKLKGDLEFWFDDWGLPRWDAPFPCALCPVTNHHGDRPWTDMRHNADWIAEIYDRATFNERFTVSHIIFAAQPGMNSQSLSADYMHDKHLGFDTYFLASVIVLLCFYVMPNTPEHNMNTLWHYIHDEFYKSADGKQHAENAYSNLTLNMCCSVSDPTASAPQLKGRAAEICALTPALHDAFNRFMDQNDDHHKKIRLCLKYSRNLDQIIHDHKDDDALPPAVAQKFKKLVFNMLTLYNDINQYASSIGRRLFNITIKCHYLCHIGIGAAYLNPRLGWCYKGEDMMHKAKILAASCVKARSMYTVIFKMMDKYLFGLHHMFTGGGLARHRRSASSR
jgi:hypothetical protein